MNWLQAKLAAWIFGGSAKVSPVGKYYVEIQRGHGKRVRIYREIVEEVDESKISDNGSFHIWLD